MLIYVQSVIPSAHCFEPLIGLPNKQSATRHRSKPWICLIPSGCLRNTVTIVEIGITNQYNLVDTEKFKKQK
ncbi:hypothetical protein BBBOND_0104470 [Babesia bigemina]|uniref:Uncharacterized protein n=1 Tax=Babesia bigemina TaxID=5866 RepID=A0A061D0D6_BABBI|nr:hypothetical protein BBBOND_0104470 [Babesia bigemina]CDR94138.1 hypothetical protein BBBOND_0104470 [Babesia bigemina]|eukprot:XP_012766324.1 hypothetical protein BBBOND_0104470 [Babesia bigemina]